MKKVIHHTYSLGTSCHTAFFFKNAGYRESSMPFDWVALDNLRNVLNILNDDFASFMDKSLYTDHVDKCDGRAGHKSFNSVFFNHFNPRKEEHYNYYQRCIERFKAIEQLPKNETVLFVAMTRYTDPQQEDLIHSIYSKLKKYFPNVNFELLVVLTHNASTRNVWRSYKAVGKNLTILHAHIKTFSLGWKFDNEQDDKRFDRYIHSLYKFKIAQKAKQEDTTEKEWK